MKKRLTNSKKYNYFKRAGKGRFFLFLCVIATTSILNVKPVLGQMEVEWVRNYPYFQDHSAAIDSSGNIYSVGDSSSVLIIFKHNPNGNLLWTRKLNYVRGNSKILAATDRNKNLYISFSNIAHNYVLVKYDSSGQFKWDYILAYGGYDDPGSIAIDSAGYIYVTGDTEYGIIKCLTVKYSPQGSVLWTRINPDYVMSGKFISLDDSGNVYVAGYYIAPGGSDYFGTLKYDNNGNLKWFSKYKYYLNRGSFGLCVKPDNKGNCYVSGFINLGDWHIISGLIKYDSKGDSIWVRVFGDSLTESGGSSYIKFDENGNIYLSSIYSLKYDTDGNLLWYRNNSYDLFTFVYQDNRMFYAGGDNFENKLGREETSMLINERDCRNGKLISQHIYPQYKWANDMLSYKNSIYIILSASDSLILIKFRTSPNNILDNTTIISDYKLHQNYPNPFNSVTNVKWSMLKAGNAKIMVYDLRGREIQTLVNKNLNAGTYNIRFNGEGLSSGVYFYSLFTDNKLIDTKKLITIK